MPQLNRPKQPNPALKVTAIPPTHSEPIKSEKLKPETIKNDRQNNFIKDVLWCANL